MSWQNETCSKNKIFNISKCFTFEIEMTPIYFRRNNSSIEQQKRQSLVLNLFRQRQKYYETGHNLLPDCQTTIIWVRMGKKGITHF